PEDMPLLNDDGLYVAGLDVAVDALSPEDALEWLESEIYEMIYDFQNHADAALIFWMPDQGRWKEDLTTSTYNWCLAGKYDAQMFPLGQCIWNGAQKDVRRIESDFGGKTNEWLGLYLERIS
ncbi:5'-nucleotidase, partial [Serratia marcescens]